MFKKVSRYIIAIVFVSGNLFSQAFQLSISGRFDGSFLMSPSTYVSHFVPCAIRIEDFNFFPEINFLSVRILPQQIQNIDTLEIDFKLGKFDYSDTSLYQIDYPDPFIYYSDSLSYGSWTTDIVGVKIKIPNFQAQLSDSIVINLTNIDWSNSDYILFYFNSNIPMGSADWQPLDIGNLWQYNIFNLDTITRLEHYEVTDSVRLNDTLFYIIDKKVYKNGDWQNIKVDTVFADSNNNIMNKEGGQFWNHFHPFLLAYAGLKVGYSTFISALACQMYAKDNLPGIEFHVGYIYRVGLTYHTDGYNDEYKKVLSATKINGNVYGQITSIFDNPISSKIEEFKFNNPFPNPFNNTTAISFTTANLSYIKINIFDIRGTLIKQLFSGYLNKGDHNLAWNAINHSSGIYIIKLATDNEYDIKKVLLIK
ncbi:MAG: T9SS type A sorting domain-containing protein [Candidatus Marinimicrobia bacterium]|nr:T9SS type A sorting domain-containing protein [Candidatus Neomarinimicrobiota bacterium]